MIGQDKTFRTLALWASAATFATFVFASIAFIGMQRRMPSSSLTIWNRWDTVHYLAIAKNGYVSTGIEQFSIAFFPFYSLLVHLFSLLLPHPLFTALAVSQMGYMGAVFYLYKLARFEESHETAMGAVLYFSIFPTAYFLHAAYPESFYLFFIFASFYYARQNHWMLAGLFGMFASTTKVTGITLTAALFVEYAHQRQFRIERIQKNILWLMLLLIPFGVQAFISWHVNSNPFYFLQVQVKHWHMNPAFPWTGFLNAWKGLSFRPPDQKITVCGSEMFFSLLGLGFTFYSLFRMRLSYGCYMLVMWLAITCSAFWMSVSRHTLYLFPMYFALARLASKRPFLHEFLVFNCVLFYGFFLTLFIQGRWAF